MKFSLDCLHSAIFWFFFFVCVWEGGGWDFVKGNFPDAKDIGVDVYGLSIAVLFF